MAAPSMKPCQVAIMVTLGSWLSIADLPVHCLRHQVAGEWEFTLSQPGPKRNSCGHMKPDSQDHQPSTNFVQNMYPHEATIVKKISLKNPNTATTDDGSKGTWTMIYDEGFEVAIGDHVYFAFSKFEWVNNHHGRTNISHCGQTELAGTTTRRGTSGAAMLDEKQNPMLSQRL
jgi:cathepsin C